MTLSLMNLRAVIATEFSDRHPLRSGRGRGDGTRKVQYDKWGDTVNTASRMESQGAPGRIQIRESTRHLIAEAYVTSPRGTIEIKEKGSLKTWFLEAAKAPAY